MRRSSGPGAGGSLERVIPRRGLRAVGRAEECNEDVADELRLGGEVNVDLLLELPHHGVRRYRRPAEAGGLADEGLHVVGQLLVGHHRAGGASPFPSSLGGGASTPFEIEMSGGSLLSRGLGVARGGSDPFPLVLWLPPPTCCFRVGIETRGAFAVQHLGYFWDSTREPVDQLSNLWKGNPNSGVWLLMNCHDRLFEDLIKDFDVGILKICKESIPFLCVPTNLVSIFKRGSI
jgi:hypothetical protein